MNIKKQDLFELPLIEMNAMTHLELEGFVTLKKLSHFHLWLLPQLVAHFGSWKPIKNSSGLWDILATLKHNIGDDPKLQAIWKLSRITRSLLLPSQTKHPQYAQFTPLILMGFKLYKDISYQSWKGLQHIEYILEPKLLEAVSLSSEQLEVIGSLGSDRLLEIRTQGLMNKSGKNQGELKPAESTWALTGIKDTELGTLPKLTQSMLTQIWIAHPSKRTQYMILDPLNWDNMPPALISGEIFTPQETIPTEQTALKLPWL